MTDAKKLKELHDKLKATEIDDSHIAEHALAAAQTLCLSPPHRTVNLNALIGISALGKALSELCAMSPEERLVIDAEIERAATRITTGWKGRIEGDVRAFRKDARGIFAELNEPEPEPDPESGTLLVFRPRIPKDLH